jgi:hypothetical protein
MQTREIVEPDAGGFEDDETSFRLEEGDFLTTPGGEVTEVGAEQEVPTRLRDKAHEAALIDVASQMSPESIERVLSTLACRLPMPLRFKVATDVLCALDFDHLGRVTREGILLINRACARYRAAMKMGKAAEGARDLVLDVVHREAAE